VEKVDIKKLFGSSVKVYRNHLGLSQEELAERSELHRTYISDVERGARNLSLLSITRLAHALGVSISALFPPGPRDKQAGRNGNHGHDAKFVDVLLVEDNADDVDLALHAFQQARFANRVQVVTDGREALDYLFREGKYARRNPGEHPQLILLDLKLPKVSGLEVLRRLKADKRTRQIPVVILTISERFDDYAECDRLGAELYIVKPLNFQRLSQVTPRLNFDWALLQPAEAKRRRNAA
jgi:CheY-like chemotaxis protein/DNA-binding XRE family transcriptional regulator